MRGLYRPVLTASLALDHALYGMKPSGFHLTNLILHGLVTLVLFLVLRRLVPGVWPAFLGALVVGLHPARSEAVAWVVGRAELLGALGCLGCLYFYLSAREGKRKGLSLCLALICYVAGSLSKENALAFPAFLVALEVLVPVRGGWERAWPRITAFGVAATALVGLRYGVLGALGPQEGERVLPAVVYPERLRLAAWCLARYLGLAAWPSPLKPNYRPLEFVESDPSSIWPALVFPALAGIALFAARRWALAAALFLVPLLTVLNLVPIGEVLAERFIYLPLAGLGIAVALLVERFEEGGARIAIRVALVALALGLGGLAFHQAGIWKNHMRLWSHAVRVDPSNPQGHLGLGVALLNAGKAFGEEPNALAEFRKVRELNRRFKPDLTAYNLGRALEAAAGRTEEALREYRLALTLNPPSAMYREAVERLEGAEK